MFDQSSRTFTFENLDNYNLSGSRNKAYTVTVTA